MRVLIAVCIALPALGGAPALADDDLRRGVEFALGTCYRQVDDLERVRSMARLFKWPRQSDDMRSVGKPVDVGAGYDGWIANYEGGRALVSVNTGRFKGRPANVCTVVLGLKPSDVLGLLQRTLAMKPAFSDVEGMQRTEGYVAAHPNLGEVLVTLVSGEDNQAGLGLSFTALR